MLSQTADAHVCQKLKGVSAKGVRSAVCQVPRRQRCGETCQTPHHACARIPREVEFGLFRSVSVRRLSPSNEDVRVGIEVNILAIRRSQS